MADYGTGPEVEDVLSSVRRLVSNEIPRKSRPVLPEGPGALLLTESHRIQSASKTKTSAKSLEERIAELEVAVSSRGDEFEPDGSEDQSEHRPNRIVYTRPPSPEESNAMRRRSLRLSQIELIETEPTNDGVEAANDEGEPLAAKFQHDASESGPQSDRSKDVLSDTLTDSIDDTLIDEAPMAEDVPQPRSGGEVAAFTKPEDVLDRLEARLNGETQPSPMLDELPTNPSEKDVSKGKTEANDVAITVAAETSEEKPETSSTDKSDPVESRSVPDEDLAFEEALRKAVSDSLDSQDDTDFDAADPADSIDEFSLSRPSPGSNPTEQDLPKPLVLGEAEAIDLTTDDLKSEKDSHREDVVKVTTSEREDDNTESSDNDLDKAIDLTPAIDLADEDGDTVEPSQVANEYIATDEDDEDQKDFAATSEHADVDPIELPLDEFSSDNQEELSIEIGSPVSAEDIPMSNNIELPSENIPEPPSEDDVSTNDVKLTSGDPLEAVVASSKAEPSPEFAEDTVESNTTTSTENTAEASDSASLEQTVVEQAIGDSVAEMLNQDSLRPVVAHMIRQELQGELGERITRNVRKLVRREIKRAMQASELE